MNMIGTTTLRKLGLHILLALMLLLTSEAISSDTFSEAPVKFCCHPARSEAQSQDPEKALKKGILRLRLTDRAE
ncbi:MAG: hypothetical protein CVV42_15085 [Candidatus Riflebacteria bacterium HGW-Riflebacteria-2]|jgi:hypothetical protein|nr:MAG: hypothetical protein CVV42_15085 [Candidatus Riflebacteria bacterium HGW-Riflebacteria-2]